jgi:hypothetical protein
MRIIILSIPASTDVEPRANGTIEIEDLPVNIWTPSNTRPGESQPSTAPIQMDFHLVVLGFWLEDFLLKIFPSWARREGVFHLVTIL